MRFAVSLEEILNQLAQTGVVAALPIEAGRPLRGGPPPQRGKEDGLGSGILVAHNRGSPVASPHARRENGVTKPNTK